jgi:Domain of unknown function (DUF397)
MSEGAYTGWRKSSYSNSSGNCVEAASTGGLVAVRDTRQGRCGLQLEFTGSTWQRFLNEIKSGRAVR